MDFLQVVSAPATEPVTLEEVKRHLKIEHDDEDADLKDDITAARQYCEALTDGRALITQTWDWIFDEFCGDSFKLPKAPAVSITSITYYDTSNTLQTLATTVYQLITDAKQSGRVALKYNQVWPSVAAREDAITIRFVAGFGAAIAVPMGLKRAMKMLIKRWRGQQDHVVDKDLADAVERLLDLNSVGTYV